MLKQIDLTYNGVEYLMLYMSDKMTDEQAFTECEFIGCGKGNNEKLFPYYIFIPKEKASIMQAITKNAYDEGKSDGYGEVYRACEFDRGEDEM